MDQNPPRVSIVMPVYNAGAYLASAITSILNQDFSDFELLIINDGSTDSSEEVIRSFTDPRIFLTSQNNKGLTATLNEAFNKCRGTYIARMDQDDISEPTRLQSQIDFLNKHSDIGIVGTTGYIMDTDGNVVTINPSLLFDEDLKLQLLYQPPFIHGSIMIRRKILNAFKQPFFRESAGNTEDYDFWVRLASITKFANIPEPLYGWRDHPNGMSNAGQQRQRTYANLVRQAAALDLSIEQILVKFAPKRYYVNEKILINNKYVFCGRGNSYAYLLYRISMFLAKRRLYVRSCALIFFAFRLYPLFFFRSFCKKI